jgi:hypothetical protein
MAAEAARLDTGDLLPLEAYPVLGYLATHPVAPVPVSLTYSVVPVLPSVRKYIAPTPAATLVSGSPSPVSRTGKDVNDSRISRFLDRITHCRAVHPALLGIGHVERLGAVAGRLEVFEKFALGAIGHRALQVAHHLVRAGLYRSGHVLPLDHALDLLHVALVFFR